MKTITGNRKFTAFILSLTVFTIIAIFKNYDLLSLGTAITLISGSFYAGNAYVHKTTIGKTDERSN